MQNYDSTDDFIVNYSGWNLIIIFNVELEIYAFLHVFIYFWFI
jgi:hypothetical protein